MLTNLGTYRRSWICFSGGDLQFNDGLDFLCHNLVERITRMGFAPRITRMYLFAPFAAEHSRYPNLNLFNLQEIEFNRGFASEHHHHYFYFSARIVNRGYFSLEVFERPVADL